MIQRILCVITAVMLCYATGNSAENSIFSSSSKIEEALQFIGAPKGGTSTQGSIITSGEYFDFSQELLSIWVKKDAPRLQNLLTQSTVELYAASGEEHTLEQWATAMTEYLLSCERENPKVFVTLIEDLTSSQMFKSQEQWFTYPETPPVAILLYSYHKKKQQLIGRMLYPVKRDGKMQLLLEKPKM